MLYFGFPAYHLELWTPLGLLSVAATVVGVIRNKPRQPTAWYLLAGAEFCLIAGDTAYNILTDVFHQDNPFPSTADAFYLPSIGDRDIAVDARSVVHTGTGRA